MAKVPPARVIRIASLMEPGVGEAIAADPVPATATLSQIAPRLIAGPASLPVVDAAGARVGRLDRMKALAVLVGGL